MVKSGKAEYSGDKAYVRLPDRSNTVVRIREIWAVAEHPEGAVVLFCDRGTLVVWPQLPDMKPGKENIIPLRAQQDLISWISDIVLAANG